VAVRNGELVLAFTPPNARTFQMSGTADELLRNALSDRFGGTWKVSVVHKSSDHPAPGTVQLPPDEVVSIDDGPDAVDQAADGERARAHDPVAFAMEALGAQIVDERERG